MSIAIAAIPAQTIPQGSAPRTLDLTQSFADNATQQADLSFSAQSNLPSVVQPSISGTTLTLNFAPTGSGIADVTVNAKAPDGSTAALAFRIKVPASADRSLDVVLGPAHRTFRYVEADGTSGTITLSGPGTAVIHMGGDNLVQIANHARGANQEIESIALTGTTSATNLIDVGVVRKKGTLVPVLGDITADGPLGMLRVLNTFVMGDITVAGGVTNFRVDGAKNGTITLGQSARPMPMKLNEFFDENFSTPSAISTITAFEWINTDSIPESFQAAYINSLQATGNFEVGLQLSSTNAGSRSLGNMFVNGVIGGTWNLAGASVALNVGATGLDWNATFTSLPFINDRGFFAGTLKVPAIGYIHVRGEMFGAALEFSAANTTDLGRLTVLGPILSTAIVSVGDLGPISAEAIQQSIVYAGVGPLQQGQALPASTADLSSTATIRSIVVHPTAKAVGFLASDIAATTIGILSLGTTRVDNSSVAFGVAATSIFHISARDLTHHQIISLSGISDPTTLANEIAATGLNLQDFKIIVLQ